MREQQAPSAAQLPAALAPGKAAGAPAISLHACAASPAGRGRDMAPDSSCAPAAAPPAAPAAQRPAPPCAPAAFGCAHTAASRGPGGAASKSRAETAHVACSPSTCRQAEPSSTGVGAAHMAEPGSPRMRQGCQQGGLVRAEAGERGPDGGPGSPMSPGGEDAAGRVLRKRKRRVRFAAGPLRELYHTRDGHPDHEGQARFHDYSLFICHKVARQRRELGATWPVDLTPGGVRMLEVELGGEVGLLPPVKRPRTYATAPRRAARAAPARRRPRRAAGMQLGPGPGSAAALDDSSSSSSSSSLTSSDASDADSGGRGGRGPGVLESPRIAAALANGARPQSPVRWSASSGGVRHGAAPSRSSGRMLMPASPRRPPRAARGPAQPASPRCGRGGAHCAGPDAFGPAPGSRGAEHAAPDAAAQGVRGRAGGPGSPWSPRRCLPRADDSPRGNGHAGKPNPGADPDPGPGSPRLRPAARLAAADGLGAGFGLPEQGTGLGPGRLSTRVGSLYDDQRSLRSLRSRPQLPALPALAQALQSASATCPQGEVLKPSAPVARGANGLGLGHNAELPMLPPLRLPPRAPPLSLPALPIDALAKGGDAPKGSAHGHTEAGLVASLRRSAAAGGGGGASSGEHPSAELGLPAPLQRSGAPGRNTAVAFANGGAHASVTPGLSAHAPSSAAADGGSAAHGGARTSAEPRRGAPTAGGSQGAGAHSGAGLGLSAPAPGSAAAGGSCATRGARAGAEPEPGAPAACAGASAPGGPCAPFRPPRLVGAKGAEHGPGAAANQAAAQPEEATVVRRRKGAP